MASFGGPNFNAISVLNKQIERRLNARNMLLPTLAQCCGSGSARIRIYFGRLDPDPAGQNQPRFHNFYLFKLKVDNNTRVPKHFVIFS